MLTRKEAQTLGLDFYTTGKQCKNGNIAPRRTDSGVCICDECKTQRHKRSNELQMKKYQTDAEYKASMRANSKAVRDKKRERARAWYHNKPEGERQQYSSAKYYKDLQTSMFNNAKTRAKRKGIPFTITKNDVIIPTMCPVFNVELKWGIGGGRVNDYSPSLDRIDSTKGYEPGNIIVMSWLANRLKNNATVDQLKTLVAFMENYAPTNAASGSDHEDTLGAV